MRIKVGRFLLRLAETEEDLRAAQRLRYAVFVEELGAETSPENHAARLEGDAYDSFCEHLILIDEEAPPEDPLDKVVGVYRLLRGSAARKGPGFYSANEFDLSPLDSYPRETLEMGRSCVAKPYRGGSAMQLLWMGLAQYIDMHGIGLLTGSASFHGSDPQAVAGPLSYLHQRKLAPPELRPRAWARHFTPMDILPPDQVDPVAAVKAMPTLIKGYLRAGGLVGDGAYVDHAFNTVDVCFVVETSQIANRYRNFYSRQTPEHLDRLLG